MSDSTDVGDVRVQKVLRVLDQNPKETVHHIACSLGISDSRLSHIVKTETGKTVRQHATVLRMRKSAQLLRATPNVN